MQTANSDSIGEVMLAKIAAEKRAERRANEKIDTKYLGMGGREKTVIDPKITAEDQNKYLKEIQRTMMGQQEAQRKSRTEQMARISKRLSRLGDKKQDAIREAFGQMDREKTTIDESSVSLNS